MSSTTEHSFTRYLAAKQSIDDRSLNRHVWEGLMAAVAAVALSDNSIPLRVLEVGAGIGTMVERCVEWGLFAGPEQGQSPRAVEMTVLDDQPENIAEARRRLPRWATAQGFRIEERVGGFEFNRNDLRLTLHLEARDLFEFAAQQHGQKTWDVLIGQALLDTLDVPDSLPKLFTLLRGGGLFYFSITFDGGTVFQPGSDPRLDDLVEATYHRSMDQRMSNGKQLGESRAGRHLFHQIRAAGGTVLDMGASDWVVFPGENGYAGDDAYLLRFIMHFVENALKAGPAAEQNRFAAWIAARREQIDRGELVYIAHQLDLLGRTPG